ncbi:MAG: Gfo/Idh/MocA family oxidoreductase [Gemmatimonadales bacterium]
MGTAGDCAGISLCRTGPLAAPLHRAIRGGGITQRPEGPLRLVAAGCGRVFERFHLPALQAQARWSLVGVADPRPERLAWIKARVPSVLADGSLASLLTRLHPDAVLISSSPESHCALADEALRSGAHVLLEKPMVLQISEARLLLDLARSGNRQIWVGFNRRFRPAYLELRARLERESGSAIRSARFELRSDPLGWNPVAPHLSQPDRSAALLQDIASHQLDLIPWLLGRNPTRVRARWLQRDAQGTRIQLDLQFEENLIASCLAGHVPGYVERLEINVGGEELLAGPGGILRRGMLPQPLAYRWLEGRSRLRAVAHKLMGHPGDTLSTFRRQLLAWAQAIGSPAVRGSSPAADGLAGARSVALVGVSIRSLAADGAWVDTPDPL